MPRFRALAIAFALTLGSVAPARALNLSARAALVETPTGQVLFERNPDERLPMASTTKVMTALTVLEKGGLDDVVTISRHASQIPPSNLELQAGEKFRVRELLYGLLLHSANDAAVALAEHYDGSEAAFAKDMTERAHALGATHTRFANPNGLPISGHYTTARDLALIMRTALANPTFREIAGTSDVTLNWPGYHAPRHVHNHNRLLAANVPVIGKTGYTDSAMHCYVGTAMGKGPLLTVVLLGSEALWSDARALLNYGFTTMGQPAYYASAPVVRAAYRVGRHHRSYVAHRPVRLAVAAVPHHHRVHGPRYAYYSRYKSRIAHGDYHRGYYRYRSAYLPR